MRHHLACGLPFTVALFAFTPAIIVAYASRDDAVALRGRVNSVGLFVLRRQATGDHNSDRNSALRLNLRSNLGDKQRRATECAAMP